MQANEVFEAARALDVDKKNTWLVLVDTAVDTTYYQNIPTGDDSVCTLAR